MKMADLDEETRDLIDLLADSYSTMDIAATHINEHGEKCLLIKCKDDKSYTITIKQTPKMVGVPWQH